MTPGLLGGNRASHHKPQRNMNTKQANYRVHDCTGGGVTEDIHADSLEDAIQQGRDWIEGGDWEPATHAVKLDAVVHRIIYATHRARVEYLADDEQSVIGTHDSPEPLTVREREALEAWLEDSASTPLDGAPETWHAYRIVPGIELPQPIEDEDATRAEERHDCSGTAPVIEAPDCVEGEDHDWRSPHCVVGGCESNPGVFGSGHGQVSITTVCARCGLIETVDHGATDPDNGQCCTETTYQDPTAESLAWVASLNETA